MGNYANTAEITKDVKVPKRFAEEVRRTPKEILELLGRLEKVAEERYRLEWVGEVGLHTGEEDYEKKVIATEKSYLKAKADLLEELRGWRR